MAPSIEQFLDATVPFVNHHHGQRRSEEPSLLPKWAAERKSNKKKRRQRAHDRRNKTEILGAWGGDE